MSQMGVYGTPKKVSGISKSNFGTLALTAAVAGTFTVGELVTGGTSTVKAKVSGYVDASTLRIKHISGGTGSLVGFTDGETITGNKSSATATVAATGFVLQKKQPRNVNGSISTVTFDTVTATDRGITITKRDGNKEVTFATALMASKSQVNDGTEDPIFTVISPPAGNYKVGSTIRLRVLSNEYLTVQGGIPTVSFTLNAAGAGTNLTGVATYMPNLSTPLELVFEYVVLADDKKGAIQADLLNWTRNSCTVTDIGGAGSDHTELEEAIELVAGNATAVVIV